MGNEQKSRKKSKTRTMPDGRGHFGPHGGRYVAETLMAALLELERAYLKISREPAFRE